MKQVKKSFTLIELLGAMVIAIIIVTMMIRIFGSSTQLMSKKFQQIDTYSTARTAINMISRDISNLYSKKNSIAGIETQMTFTNTEITIYTYGAVNRPSISDESLITKEISVPQKVTYIYDATTKTINKDTFVYDFDPTKNDFSATATSALSGTLIEGVRSFSVQAFKKDMANNYIAETIYNDGENPYLVILDFEFEPATGSASSSGLKTYKFTKTIVTEPSF